MQIRLTSNQVFFLPTIQWFLTSFLHCYFHINLWTYNLVNPTLWPNARPGMQHELCITVTISQNCKAQNTWWFCKLNSSLLKSIVGYGVQVTFMMSVLKSWEMNKSHETSHSTSKRNAVSCEIVCNWNDWQKIITLLLNLLLWFRDQNVNVFFTIKTSCRFILISWLTV